MTGREMDLRRPYDNLRRRPSSHLVVCGFWASIATTVAAVITIALVPRSTEFDLGSAPWIEHVGGLVNGADFGRSIPDNCVLRLKKRELERVFDRAEVGEQAGRYFLDGERGIVLWSSPFDARFRPELFAYKLVANPGGHAPFRGLVALLLVPAAGVVIFGLLRARRQCGNREQYYERPWQRMFVTATSTVCLLVALIPGWNNLISAPDSNSYLTHSEIRTPLVPWLIESFSRNSVDRVAIFDEFRMVEHWGGGHPLIAAVRAWKLLLAASVGLLVWELSGVLNWWALGALAASAGAFDVALGHWSRGLTGYLDVVLSEGLSHALTYLCLALTAGYLQRPNWTRGVLLALNVNLLLLARPGNLPFLAVFGLVAVFHLIHDGIRGATARAGTLGALTAVGMLLHCGVNYANYGHFKQHAFAGFNLMTTALQLATPADVELFSDRELRELVRVCTVDFAGNRNPELTDAAATQNCWQIACPAFERVFGRNVSADYYDADAVFTEVAHTLVRAHRAEFAAMVAGSFVRGFWSTWLHVPLLVLITASFAAFVRTKSWPYLFVAWLASMPFLLMIPCCLTNTPLDRYRSQVYVLEIWTIPLFAAICIPDWQCRRTKDGMEGSRRNISRQDTDHAIIFGDARQQRANSTDVSSRSEADLQSTSHATATTLTLR